MTIVHTGPERALRSLRADWNRERWEQLPDDGNRYEVIDRVLYMTTAPSAFHQWIVRQIVRALFVQIDDRGVGVTLWAPIGVFMTGCVQCSQICLSCRRQDWGSFTIGASMAYPILSSRSSHRPMLSRTWTSSAERMRAPPYRDTGLSVPSNAM